MVREAVSILSNAIKYGTLLQKSFLYKKGVLDCFISLLVSTDKKILKVVLEGILNFVNEDDLLMIENSFKKDLKDKDAINKINKLQEIGDEKISQRTKEIIKLL